MRSTVIALCFASAAANPLGLISPTADTLVPLPSPVIPSYAVLNRYCEDAGSDAYVGVQYANGVITSYNFGECYPYTVNGSAALAAVFCKSVTCKNCAGDNCTDPNLTLTVPRSSVLVNPWGLLTTVLGKGAICQKPSLSLPVRSSDGPGLSLGDN
ncbi:f9a1f612-6c8d-460e-b26b-dd704c827574 [Sclerotinia trifoliorum]|uniref:F9a1f612-6c8d-460e-b26b-dd704c827574 n=1 Tax=Sclerotinia trifoliorum TaxID=28548 RepID=A0A8H2W4C6_9HELO|nr:f9a1f612-6c8d-460e-b26b-dd704c827574 [Sclerotinia trifoliorum]